MWAIFRHHPTSGQLTIEGIFETQEEAVREARWTDELVTPMPIGKRFLPIDAPGKPWSALMPTHQEESR